MGVEQLDELGEVGERAGQAIDLVDHHHINRSGLYVAQEPLQGRAVHRPSREAAIIVVGFDQDPALMGLALDVGLGGLALRVERIEILLQPMLGRDPGVDGAAQTLDLPLHHETSRRPKKRGPFQRVPVMARATSDRLL